MKDECNALIKTILECFLLFLHTKQLLGVSGFTEKRNANGYLKKYKVRIVVKDFQKQHD